MACAQFYRTGRWDKWELQLATALSPQVSAGANDQTSSALKSSMDSLLENGGMQKNVVVGSSTASWGSAVPRKSGPGVAASYEEFLLHPTLKQTAQIGPASDSRPLGKLHHHAMRNVPACVKLQVGVQLAVPAPFASTGTVLTPDVCVQMLSVASTSNDRKCTRPPKKSRLWFLLFVWLI